MFTVRLRWFGVKDVEYEYYLRIMSGYYKMVCRAVNLLIFSLLVISVAAILRIGPKCDLAKSSLSHTVVFNTFKHK